MSIARLSVLFCLLSLAVLSFACGGRQAPEVEDIEDEGAPQAGSIAAEAPAGEILDGASVRRVVEAGEHRVQACYQQWLDAMVEEESIDEETRIAGRLLIAFLVDEEGRVEEIEVLHSDFEGAAFEPCVLREIARWRFPRPAPEDVPVGVEIPFYFEPRVD